LYLSQQQIIVAYSTVFFQLFAVQLSSYLCLQFPLPKALDVAKYVMSRMTSLCEALPGDRCASFFIPACECLLRFCRAFPPLSMDTSSLLLLIGQLTASRSAGSCGDELGKCNGGNSFAGNDESYH
jgi:hypothetical protein